MSETSRIITKEQVLSIRPYQMRDFGVGPNTNPRTAHPLLGVPAVSGPQNKMPTVDEYEAALQKGYDAGMREARAEVSAQFAQDMTNLQDTVTRLQAALAAAAATMPNLAWDLAQQAVGHFVGSAPQTIPNTLLTAMQAEIERVTRGDVLAVVRLHPAWMAVWTEIFADNTQLRVEWDPNLHPWGFVLDSRFENVDWSLPVRWGRVVESMQTQLGSTTVISSPQ